MRIKHTANEFYYLQSCYLGKSQLFKNVRRWYPYKIYHTKAAALRALATIKEKRAAECQDLIWRILWFPHPFAEYEQSVCVYTEDPGVTA